MSTDAVKVETNEAVEIIRLDRPDEMNALTGEMFDAMSDALVLGEGDSKIRAFVIAGSAGMFTQGADDKELEEYLSSGSVTPGAIRFMKTLATLDKPVIAAVDGPALGIGTTMLFLCDYVIASEWSMFGVDHVGAGLPLDAAASLLAPRVIGHHVAFELLILGDTLDTARAKEVGLVNKIVEAESVEQAALEVATRLAERPPEAVRLAKRLLVGDRRDVVTRITSEASSFAALQRSPHASAALRERLRRGASGAERM
jgi:enoyl-CoA hydratase/carnithine racemase